jgi:hypothetical protein
VPGAAVEALRRALLWAAGLAPDAPDLAALDEERLLGALAAHRLEARFHRRLQEGAVAAPPGLRARAARRHREIEAAFAAHVAAAAGLVASLREREGIEPIVVKGFTPYALSGAPAGVRRPGDVDLIAPDPLRLTEALLERGYVETAERERVHAFSELTAPGLDVDVHSYFPISVTGRRAPPQVTPALNPGVWLHDAHLSTHRLGYEAIHRRSRLGAGPGTEAIRVAGPELATVMVCAQMQRDYVTLLFPAPRATSRLDDLAVVRELVATAGFDRGLLARLVEEHEAQAAIAFVAHLLRAFAGADPFAALSGADTRWATLRDLWWDSQDGFLVDLGLDPGELILRTATMADLLDALQPAALRSGRTYALGADGDGAAPIERAVVRRHRGAALPLRVRVDRDERGVAVEAAIPLPPAGSMTVISLNFGDERYELFHVPGQAPRVANYSIGAGARTADVEVSVELDGEHRARLALPLALVSHAAGEGPLPLLLGARHQRLPWGRTAGETMVPAYVSG